jgi:hypothetical protein
VPEAEVAEAGVQVGEGEEVAVRGGRGGGWTGGEGGIGCLEEDVEVAKPGDILRGECCGGNVQVHLHIGGCVWGGGD